MLYTPWRNEQKAVKNTANKNSKKKKKDATSTIQGCEPRDCTIKGIQSSPKHNPKTVATTNVTVSGQPLAPPAPSSSTMCTEVTESTDGKPPPQSSSTMCTESTGGQPPHNHLIALVVNRSRNRLQPCALRALVLNRLQDPRLQRLELPFRQVLKVHI